MKISLDTDMLVETIRTAQRMVGATAICGSVEGSFLFITAIGSTDVCRMSTPCKVEEKGKLTRFSVEADRLLAAVNKRKNVNIKFDANTIVVSAQRYETELICIQTDSVEVIPKEIKESKALVINDKFISAMAANLPKIDLKPLLSNYSTVPMGIRSSDKGTFVACFDHYQSAFYYDKDLTGKLDFMLPGNVFQMLAKELKNRKYKLALTEGAIYAWNDDFELSMVNPDSSNGITIDQMWDLYQNLKKGVDGKTLVFQAAPIREMIENSKSIYEQDAVFLFKTAKNICKLELKSSFGSMTTTFKLNEAPKKDVEFKCDFSFFSQLLTKAPEEVKLLVTESMLLFKNKNITYLLSLV